jgi:SAM-dependent methyltransferase
MKLDRTQLEELRQILLGPSSDELIRFIVDVAMGRNATEAPAKTVELAQGLGLVVPGTQALTRTGYLLADSLREYTFWLERGRQLPCEGTVPHLSSAYFAGKKIVEIGCGAGCNLWSLRAVSQDVIGIEPEPLYPLVGQILCEREGIPAPEIKLGSAEALPLGDGEFDVAICITSHQYTDVTAGLKEIVRILRPGGEVLLVGGTLDTYLKVGSERIRRGSLRAIKPFAVTVANTLFYVAMGRRLINQKGRGTTAYPVYPTVGYMKRQLQSLGLVPSRPLNRIYPDTCFSYRMPLDHSPR